MHPNLTPIFNHPLFANPYKASQDIQLIPTYTCVAAISVNPTTKDDPLTPNPTPIGIAVVKLIGNYYEHLECVVLEDRPFEPVRIIDRLLKLSQLLSFNKIYLDKDNYIIFAADQLFNKRKIVFERENPIVAARGQQESLPSLSPVQRSENVILRQQLSLTQPINDKILHFSKSVNEVDKNSILDKSNYGTHAKSDALAIAVTEALKIKNFIYQNIDDDQRRLMQSKGKSLY